MTNVLKLLRFSNSRSILSLVLLTGLLAVTACSTDRTGSTTREQCSERFWDDQDGDGWGECISETAMLGGLAQLPSQVDSCDGTDSCYEPSVGDSGESIGEDPDPSGFNPYWNGRELVECPDDYWGSEPCG